MFMDKLLSISRSWFFSWPDASRDRCQEPGCGVQRMMHGRAHKFKEHPSKGDKK